MGEIFGIPWLGSSQSVERLNFENVTWLRSFSEDTGGPVAIVRSSDKITRQSHPTLFEVHNANGSIARSGRPEWPCAEDVRGQGQSGCSTQAWSMKSCVSDAFQAFLASSCRISGLAID